jgi:hypothetical protein
VIRTLIVSLMLAGSIAALPTPHANAQSPDPALLARGSSAAGHHTAYGGRPEADHARPCRGHFPQVRAGFSIARQEVAQRMELTRLRSREPAYRRGRSWA